MPRRLRSIKRDFRAGYQPERAAFDPDSPLANSMFDCQNVNLQAGSAIKRGGLRQFNVHPVGFTKIADMEEAGWTIGTADAIIFREGAGSLKIENTDSDPQAQTTILTFGAKNLGTTASDKINIWLNTIDVLDPLSPGAVHWSDVDLKLETSAGNHFEKLVALAEADFVTGWNLISVQRDDFASTGAPNWASITKLYITVRRHTGAVPIPSSIILYLDDFLVNPEFTIKNIIDYLQKDGTQKKLAFAGTQLWQSSSGDTSWTSVITGLTNNLRLGWAIFNDHLIFGNGTDVNSKFKTVQSNLGFGEPPAAATFDSNINGTMADGDSHFYRFTYFNSTTGHEGNPSPASAAMGALVDPNDGIRITIPADGAVDAQVDEVIVYRTLEGQPVNSQYFRILGTHAYSGSLITVDDLTPDSGIIAEILEFDNTAPAKFKMVVHDGLYVYYAGDPLFPSRVWRSKARNAESVPPLSFTEIGPDDGEKVEALELTRDGRVIAFKRNSKYRILDLGRGIVGHRYINNRGTFNTESVRRTPTGIAYLHSNSVWLFDGARDINLGTPIRKDIRDLSGTNVQNSIVGYDRFDDIIRVAVVPAGQSQITAELLFDVKENAWTKHTTSYTAVGEYVSGSLPNDVVGTIEGFVFSHDTTATNDDDIAIDAFVKGPHEDFGRPERLKKFRTLIVWVAASGSYDLSVKFIKDYGLVEGNESLISLASGALWGTFVWGVDVWGSQTVLRVEIPVPIADRMASALQVKFANKNISETFRVYGYALTAQVMRGSS